MAAVYPSSLAVASILLFTFAVPLAAEDAAPQTKGPLPKLQIEETGDELTLAQADDPLNTTVENPSPGNETGESFPSAEIADDPLNTTIENPTVEPLARHDGFDFAIDETKKVNVGAGLRVSFNAIEDSSPNERMWSRDVNLDNVRIYINGKAHEYIGFEVNTDINNAQPLLARISHHHD